MLLTKKRKAKLYKLFGKRKLPFLPFILNIETGNICNLRCPLCPTGAGERGLEKGFMEFNLFRKIIDDLKDSLDTINLYSWGEPLLNKDLISMINYAKKIKPSLKIITSTNLNIRDKQLLAQLLESGIDENIVSCDGATSETYLKYRVGGDFNLVIENLRFLTGEKKRLKADTKIVWNFLVFKHNEQELEKARQMAEEIGVTFRIGLMRISMKDEILRPHSESIKNDIDWIPDNPLYSAYDKEKCLPKKKIKTCRKPWQEITVNWDGSVFPCCAVYGDIYKFGNIKESNLRDIWNNENYCLARKEIISNNSKNTICGICHSHGFMHM